MRRATRGASGANQAGQRRGRFNSRVSGPGQKRSARRRAGAENSKPQSRARSTESICKGRAFSDARPLRSKRRSTASGSSRVASPYTVSVGRATTPPPPRCGQGPPQPGSVRGGEEAHGNLRKANAESGIRNSKRGSMSASPSFRFPISAFRIFFEATSFEAPRPVRVLSRASGCAPP